jgi:hypothetical protein
MKNLFFVLVFLVCGLGLAQEKQITGSVLDGEFKNQPLVFAKVSIKNTNQFINTDLNGNFILNLTPGTYTLIYKFSGYEPIEIQDLMVKNKNIYLKEVILSAKK